MENNTMKEIQKTIGWLVVAAALTTGMTACSSDDNIAEQMMPTTEIQKTYSMTVEATKGSTTRALSLDGSTLNATWTKGDAVTVIGPNAELTDFEEKGTLYAQSDGATTTLSGTLDKALIDGCHFFLVFPKLFHSWTGQKGTLADIAANYDYTQAYFGEDEWSETDGHITTTKPANFLNDQAIVRFTLKDKSGNLLNASSLNIRDEEGLLLQTENALGDLTITPDVPTSEIWAALYYMNATIHITLTATVGAFTYTYSKSGVTFDEGKFYSVAVKMTKTEVNLAALTGDYTAQDGETLTGTLGGNYKVSIADGAKVTLRDVTVNGTDNDSYQWAGITCAGDAEITLSGTNTLRGFYENCPGIYVPTGKTLTIKGTGSLDASSNGYAAGIGGGYGINCGNIFIEGGTITATGGEACAAIGGGTGALDNGSITIANTVTKVTATKGERSYTCIGFGSPGSCGTVTIGGTVYWDYSNEKERYDFINGGADYLGQSTLVYQP